MLAENVGMRLALKESYFHEEDSWIQRNHLASRNIQSYTVKEHIYLHQISGGFSQLANFDKNCKDTIISSITPTPHTS